MHNTGKRALSPILIAWTFLLSVFYSFTVICRTSRIVDSNARTAFAALASTPRNRYSLYSIFSPFPTHSETNTYNLPVVLSIATPILTHQSPFSSVPLVLTQHINQPIVLHFRFIAFMFAPPGVTSAVEIGRCVATMMIDDVSVTLLISILPKRSVISSRKICFLVSRRQINSHLIRLPHFDTYFHLFIV